MLMTIVNSFDDDLKLQINGRKNDPAVSLIETPSFGNGSTGGYCTEVSDCEIQSNW